MPRELRYGMVGGGRGAFIGGVHRIAAAMDGRAKLVAGAFSSDLARARASGADLGVSPDRTYTTYAEMARAESRLPPDRRVDFVIVVTPNHLHFPVAQTFLGAGFHVVCDKPVATSLAEARRLQRLVRRSGRLFMLTHNLPRILRHARRGGSRTAATRRPGFSDRGRRRGGHGVRRSGAAQCGGGRALDESGALIGNGRTAGRSRHCRVAVLCERRNPGILSLPRQEGSNRS